MQSHTPSDSWIQKADHTTANCQRRDNFPAGPGLGGQREPLRLLHFLMACGIACLLLLAASLLPIDAARAGPNSFTQRISDSATGVQGNRPSTHPSISGEGDRVAFVSAATNLSETPTGERTNIFVKERSTGTLWLASVSSGGAEGDAGSEDPHLSRDGRFVVFASTATNLVAGDTNGVADIFVRDLQEGTTTLLSRSSAGVIGNLASVQPDISANGRYVVFASAAGNLTIGDFNGRGDIFLHDRDTDNDGIFDEAGAISTRVISLDGEGSIANGSSDRPAISDNGRYVVYESLASNLIPNDTNSLPDIFLHDRDMDGNGIFDEPGGVFTQRINVASGGGQANSFSENAQISGDGRQVAFESFATNLVAGGTSEFRKHVFVRDWQASRTVLVSRAAGGTEANEWSENPALSQSGRYISFESTSDNLVAGDTNSSRDIFLVDRDGNGNSTFDEAGETGIQRISLTQANGQMVGGQAFHADLSADASLVVFDSDAANLGGLDSNGVADVFVRGWGIAEPPSAVDLNLSISGATIVLGATTRLTFTIDNRGTTAATGVRLLTQYEGTGLVNFHTPSQGNCSVADCQLGTVTPSLPVTIPMQLTSLLGRDTYYIGSVSIGVEALSTEADGNPLDNRVEFTVDFYNCEDDGNGCVLDELFCYLFGQFNPFIPSASLSRAAPFLPDLALYYHLRDRVMHGSAEGRRYAELYYAHSPEITQLVFADTALRDQFLSSLQQWEPHLRALVDGQGETVAITAEQTAALDAVLSALSTAGSPALQQTIDDERAKLPAFDTFIGKTMAQARSETVGYGLVLPLISGP